MPGGGARVATNTKLCPTDVASYANGDPASICRSLPGLALSARERQKGDPLPDRPFDGSGATSSDMTGFAGPARGGVS